MKNRFYVVRVKYLADGTQKKSELMDYATEVEAESKFHKNLGEDMDDLTLIGGMCTVLDSFGNPVRDLKRGWRRQAEPTE